jgi:hypothetical protein
MRCENIPPLLILDGEGALGPLATWRLRRHLAACPGCAADHAEFGRLDARLRAADPAAGFLAASNRRENHRPERPAAPSFRRRALLAGVTAAALAAFGVATVFAPGQVAFAQVQQAMAAVRTAEWTETETWFLKGIEDGPARVVAKTRVRARMDPPVLLYETKGRQEGNGREDQFTNISLKTPDDFRTYRSQTREIILMPYSGPNVTREGMAAGLRGEILGKLTFTPPDASSAAANKLNWETQKVLLNGKPAVQFTFRPAPQEGRSERSVFTLWADPETKRVLRTVHEQRDVMTGALTHLKVTEDIRCDVPVADSAFTLNAPSGTPIYHENYMWDRGSSVTLTPEEKARVNRLIDETYAGILASDWKRVSAGWDLGYAASLPKSPVPPGGLERWLRRKVAAGRQYKVMRRLAVSGINSAPYTRVLGFGDATVPAGKARLVAVTLTPGILYRDDFQEIGTETFYFRRDAKEGFRIVGWQYPEGQREQWRRQWLEKGKGHTR